MTERFECGAAFDQHAALRCTRNRAQHRAWHRDGERAGARGDQHRHGAIETLREGLIDDDPSKEEGADQDEHARDKDAFELLGEILRRRTLRFRLRHQGDYARQHALSGKAGDAHVEYARAVDCAGKHAVLLGRFREIGVCIGAGGGLFFNRRAFAGDRRLIDRARPGDNDAVGREPLIGPDHDDVADFEIGDSDLFDFVAPAQLGAIGGQLAQSFNGALGAPHGPVFERVSKTEEKEQQRAFGPSA